MFSFGITVENFFFFLRRTFSVEDKFVRFCGWWGEWKILVNGNFLVRSA